MAVSSWLPDLEIAWYLVFVLCMICYAMLDGFDLGVGILHVFAKGDYERRVFVNAIGPVWDGNAVWLIVIIGGLFAGFPRAYATLFSAFYTPLTILIAGLILRAVAIEFRGKIHSPSWRGLWDWAFCLGSLVIAFGIGVALGNLIQGIPLNQNQDFTGNFFTFMGPYPLLVGLTTTALFMMHGAIFLVMKTEGELHDKLRGWVNPTIIFFIICYACTTMATLIYQPHMVQHLQERPVLFLIAIISMLAIANIPREINRKKDGWAFVSSCVSIALLLVLYAIGTFPVIVRSSINPELYSMTVWNSGSSVKTLGFLLGVVAIGIPLVIAYAFLTYRIFRGKVKMDSMSY
jgi:cytochrome d ubiquinol oxidase subunit II